MRVPTPPASSRSAFTLIEALAAISVMALLLALLVPGLGRAHKAAKGAVCLSNLRSFGAAVALYANDHDGRYPSSSHSAGSLVAQGAWLASLQPYGIDAQPRKCPMDPYPDSRLTSYATNEHFEPLTAGIDYSPITHRPLPGGRTKAFTRRTLVPRPAATVYAFEPEGEGTADHINTHAFATADDLRAAVAVTRHAGAGHFLFADGRAAAWSWTDLAASFSPATSPFDPEVAR